MKFLGGIRWGFGLSNYRIRPTITQPSPLSFEDFNKDIEIIKKILPSKHLGKNELMKVVNVLNY